MTTSDPQSDESSPTILRDLNGGDNRNCPNCRYDLAGLPPKHRCPECGFQYDPHAVVIDLHGKRIRFNDWYGLCFVLGGGIMLVFLIFGDENKRSELLEENAFAWYNILDMCYSAVLAVLGIVAFVRFWRRWGAKQSLRINHLGVQFIDPDLRGDLIPWERIGQAERDDARDALVIKDRSNAAIMSCPLKLIGDKEDVGLCLRKLNGLRRIYCGEDRPSNGDG